MPRISLEEMIQGYSQMTPEQVNFFRHFYATFDNRSAANRRITNVEPLFFTGGIAGSEFETYAATKLYIALKARFDGAVWLAAVNINIAFYNEANAVFMNTQAISASYDSTTPAKNASSLPAEIENFYFSRIVRTSYTYMIFNGFRITLV